MWVTMFTVFDYVSSMRLPNIFFIILVNISRKWCVINIVIIIYKYYLASLPLSNTDFVLKPAASHCKH